MDAVTAARRLLVSQPSLMALLGKDAVYADGWVFRWHLYVTVEGTGSAAVVLSQRPGLSPNSHNTMEFPQLLVAVYADLDRHGDRNPELRDAEDLALAVAGEVSRILHVPEGREMRWGDPGGIRVIASTRAAEPTTPTEVPQADGMVRLEIPFQLVVG